MSGHAFVRCEMSAQDLGRDAGFMTRAFGP